MAKIYRRAVMAVIVNDKKEILIGYSPRDKSYKFPQGGLIGDEDALTGIKRELLEELDYNLKDKDVLKIFEEKIHYPYPPGVHPVFKGQELEIVLIRHNPKNKITPQDDEFDKMLWIKPEAVSNFDSNYRAKAYLKALEICKLL